MNIMIYLKNVRRENDKILAEYYPENSEIYNTVSVDIETLEFNGSLLGHYLESHSHLAHAKFALLDMVKGKRKIADCQIVWF